MKSKTPISARSGGESLNSRGATGHGRPYNSTDRSNPVVHSKATRRYGHDETTGTPGGARPAEVPDKAPVFQGAVGKPVSQQVGFLTPGSDKVTRAALPNTRKATT